MTQKLAIKVAVLLCVAALPVFSAPADNIGIGTTTTAAATWNFSPRWMAIACGKGSVRVELETGHVTYDQCKPDEAAEKFWKAVELYGAKCGKGNK